MSHRARIVAALVVMFACRPETAFAQPPRMPPDSLRAQLDLARELLKNAEYDRDIEMLGNLIQTGTEDVELLGQSYLLLIKAHLYLRNYSLRQPQGRTSADLNQAKARELTIECLGRPELRHLRPIPEVDYPAEMLQLFRDVRNEVQGGFRVTRLFPLSASVVLDTDTLRADSSGVSIEAADLPVGRHAVQVFAAKYIPIHESIDIAPGVTLERPYVLKPRHGALWYGSRVAIVGGVGTVVYLATRSKPEGDLPSSPPPPPSGSGR